MAIASLVIYTNSQNPQGVVNSLRTIPEILESVYVGDGRIASTIEARADLLPSLLAKIPEMPEIINLDLVGVNYEDDLEAGGISCPPLKEIFKQRKK